MCEEDRIQRVLTYMEENLPNEMNNAELARVAGYSEYHFLRLFKKKIHLTPAEYLRKRRITEIVRKSAEETGTIAEIAFACGFNSKENFIRAFKREHHVLPNEFRTAQNSLKLCGQALSEKDVPLPDVSLVRINSFRVVAYRSDEAFPPHFWNRYNVNQWSKRLSGGQTVEDIGVSIWNAEQNRLDYFIGVREEDACGDRTGTELLDVPGGDYAVFRTPASDLFGFVDTIHRTWDYIAREWLPANGYRRTGGAEFECYTEESKTFSEKIYIPIKKEEDAE